MDDSNIRELPRPVAKEPRSAAAIMLADLLSSMATKPPARALLVAWSEPGADGDGEYFRFKALGTEAMLVYLAERCKVALCAGLFDAVPPPSDGPR